MLTPLRTIVTQDAELQRVQDNVGLALSPLLGLPIANGNYLQGIALIAGQVNQVPHGLGRKTQGWAVTRKRNPAVDESWIAATLENSWVNAGTGYNDASYRIRGDGTVELRGLVKNGTAAPITVFTLPAAYRPAGNMNFVVASSDGTDKLAQCRIAASTGAVSNYNGFTSNFSLDGIRFAAANPVTPEAVVWDDQDTGALQERMLRLRCSASCTVDLLVF